MSHPITSAGTTTTSCREGKAITVDQTSGWKLIIDQSTGSPVVEIGGRCNATGIDALLDLAIAVNIVTNGNVFR